MPDRRPNILFLLSDQHRFDCLGVNGHPQVATPALDTLAAAGVNFTHAFTPAPICVPTRCSLLTGAWPWRHGTVMNFDGESYRPLDDTLPVYPHLLREVGYITAHVGRWHVKPGSSPLNFGYDTHLPGGGSEEPKVEGGYDYWRAKQGLPARPEPGFFGEKDPYIS